jgi:hypothetical protein
VSPERDAGLLALDEALTRLAEVDPRKGRVVELRYFGGLSVEETAKALQVSPEKRRDGSPLGRTCRSAVGRTQRAASARRQTEGFTVRSCCRQIEAVRQASPYRAQSSHINPSTRSNSRLLAVTSVRPRRTDCPAISAS